MAGPEFVPPGRSGIAYQAPTKEMLQIRDDCKKLWELVQDIKNHPADKEYRAALDFFGRVRVLSNVVKLLTEQPGIRPGDERGKKIKEQMKGLSAKMEELTKKLNSTVNLMDPLPYTAPKRVEWSHQRAGEIAEILLNPEHVKAMEAVVADKNLSWQTKEVFFDWVGHFINDALTEVVKSKQHETQILEAVRNALQSHRKDTMIGACLWFSQTAASAGGNLPGPNSLYVGAVRLRLLDRLKDVPEKGAQSVLSDTLHHFYDGLKLSDTERATFQETLEKIAERQKKVAVQATDLAEQRAQEIARKEIEQLYKDKLVPMVKEGGSPQSGPGLSFAMSALNLICLVFVWQSMPDTDWSVRNIADFASASTLTATGIAASFFRWKLTTSWMAKVINSAVLGKGLGVITGMISVIEGIDTVWDAAHKSKTDWWMVASGTLQFGSGVAIVVGALFGLPGTQIIGVLVGLAAGLVAVAGDALTDPMVEFFNDQLKELKTAKCVWDGSLIMRRVGVEQFLKDLEALVETPGVQALAYDRDWHEHGVPVAKDKVIDRLHEVGIDDPYLRVKLIRVL